jgi:hypothetical protein
MNHLSPARVPLARDVLATAYRTTFQEYSNKLEALQRLMDASLPGRGPVDARLLDANLLDATLLEVEKARVAHNCARNELARELLRSPALLAVQQNSTRNVSAIDSGIDEGHIRETAQLLWEMAGRPEGTADGDWSRAERLVLAAAAGAC